MPVSERCGGAVDTDGDSEMVTDCDKGMRLARLSVPSYRVMGGSDWNGLDFKPGARVVFCVWNVIRWLGVKTDVLPFFYSSLGVDAGRLRWFCVNICMRSDGCGLDVLWFLPLRLYSCFLAGRRCLLYNDLRIYHLAFFTWLCYWISWNILRTSW